MKFIISNLKECTLDDYLALGALFGLYGVLITLIIVAGSST